jgi:hypothetical protein
MEISRRTVLAGLAATAAAASLPLAPAVEAAIVEVPAAAPVPDGWWGYSFDGEFWNGPFASREDALAEAQGDYPEEACLTGRCIPHQMDAPDLREACVLWLHDGCTEDSLYGDICWLFEGANEDHDYEGEVHDALSVADWNPLIADLKDIFAVAVFRHGRADLIGAIIAGAEVDAPLVSDDLDPLLVALENDDLFEAELTAAAEAWMVAQKLKDAPRRLDLREEESHPALEPEESA